MVRGINKVTILGNIGTDPEVRYTARGTAIVNITLATTENWRDKQTGDLQDQTEWHRLVFFGRLAEIAGQYLRKGSKVYVEGKLRTRKWQDKSGIDRSTTEIIVNEMILLDRRTNSGSGERDFQSDVSQDFQQNRHHHQPGSMSEVENNKAQMPNEHPAMSPANPAIQNSDDRPFQTDGNRNYDNRAKIPATIDEDDIPF